MLTYKIVIQFETLQFHCMAASEVKVKRLLNPINVCGVWYWVLPAGGCALWSGNLSSEQVSLMVGKVFLTSFRSHCRLDGPRGLLEGEGDICELVIIVLYCAKSSWFILPWADRAISMCNNCEDQQHLLNWSFYLFVFKLHIYL